VLAGRGSWWVPEWADRVLPHLDIEGTASASGRAPAVPASGAVATATADE
jgi:RND superfamily putative drug exporter